ncbi:MAG: twin-arginine translocase TatA/TatE family subunit, partial [Planctomycetes bacterium]|nr:twin-arginine translocase TatA/TatE family subunit [Planctomycetota bacterium]NUQ34798.1 twin-arginine translocase TatA/TatE family subunit [Planctomycetaceae bacterium]
MNYLGLFGWLNGHEWIVLVVLGLLLFGRKLPGIARSLGQSVVEFKKGIKGVKDDSDAAASLPSQPQQVQHQAPASPVIDVTGSSKPAAEPKAGS